jgi:hypothetical protein
VYEKKFSKGKTLALVAATAGAVAFLVSKGGISFPEVRDPEREDTIEQRRGRMPFPTRPGLPPFLRSLNPPRSH